MDYGTAILERPQPVWPVLSVTCRCRDLMGGFVASGLDFWAGRGIEYLPANHAHMLTCCGCGLIIGVRRGQS